jgi:two-component system, cell cycle response regulator
VLAFDHTPAVDARDLALAIATRRTATMLVLRGRSLGKLYKLEGARFLIGRAATADIVLDDDGVSRFHAVITQEAEKFRVEDLGSKNGVIVNGFKVSDHVLEEGDRIQLGATTLLKFTHQDDIEEQFQEELYKSSTVDPLTGIYNRRHVIERLRSECAYARRQGTVLSVLMIDVDHFKQVNDTHGHLAGDAVLRGVAKAIQASLRAEDVFGRYGGEELCVILRGIEATNALLAAQRIVELVRGVVVEYQGKSLKVTVSVGASTSSPNLLDTPQELLDAADRALYRAKEAGRDRCVQ